ncbi:hypothetical protein BDA99DRAFT_532181 [Phascolomyces articulosus]|uniref:Uncharacterized protein n=1 Tax=Phascolomyces articulosus TaxID=60185 RepID=A0AAD5KBK0_9FUNG|nr:hypothetical protein BDA99DRAFT_532181 [Phascolomyces articulosus]
MMFLLGVLLLQVVQMLPTIYVDSILTRPLAKPVPDIGSYVTVYNGDILVDMPPLVITRQKSLNVLPMSCMAYFPYKVEEQCWDIIHYVCTTVEMRIYAVENEFIA